MMKVGITGGIGSGKTTVCRIFEELGVPVFYADAEAKKLLFNDASVVTGMISTFGNKILDDSGKPDRRQIAKLVFNNKHALEQLNSIIHPAVALSFQKWLGSYEDHPYIIKEAAILFESGAYKELDKIFTVSAPEEMRIQRVMDRDGAMREEVEKRMSNQLSEKERNSRADHIIRNDERELVIPQVIRIHEELIELSKSGPT